MIERYRRILISLFGLALLLVSVNVVASRLLPDQVDLTRRRVHTLSPLTRNLLDHLDRKVEIALLVSREPRSAADREFSQAGVMIRELIDLYRQRQPSIAIRELDPDASVEARQLLQRYPDVATPCVLVRFDDERPSGHEVLQARDLAEVHRAGPDRSPMVEFFGEQALTAALVRLTTGRRQTVVYALSGHGELSLDDEDESSRRGLGVLLAQWRELDIEVRSLDLRTTPRVPADAGLVLAAGGDQPYAPAEIEALRRYWMHGGRGLVLCDLACESRESQVIATGLERLLTEFGVQLGDDRVVMQGLTGRIDAAAPALPAVGEHPLVRSLSPASVMLYECRSVRQSNVVSRSSLRSIPLLVSHPAPLAWADGDLTFDGEPESGGTNDLPGPVSMALAVERRQGDRCEPVLVVVGDAEFLDNRSLSGPSGRAASSFALAAVNWLRGRRDLLGDIPPRRNEGYRLPGTADEQRGLVWKSTLLLSALIVSAGATVWVSRREGG
jgi:ABC-type uncharacterized transport system involved in gliding motility auxiliary subunit